MTTLTRSEKKTKQKMNRIITNQTEMKTIGSGLVFSRKIDFIGYVRVFQLKTISINQIEPIYIK